VSLQAILSWPLRTPVVRGAALLLALLAPLPAAAQPAADNRLDSIARLLAGLPPTHPDHARFAELPAWKEHSRVLQESWAKVRDGQAKTLIAWRQAEIPAGCPVGNTLLYPFAGADFLNAHWLFPGCRASLLFGLERIGDVPAIEKMSDKAFEGLLGGVRNFMINLFARNYFVTETMNKSFRADQVRGVTPVFMVLMALSEVEVLKIGRAPLVRAPEAPTVAERKRQLRGVAIEYRAGPAAPVQRLEYYAFDATDAAIGNYPEILDHIRSLQSTTTLLKAASYLLHGNEFSRMREAILDVTRFLVQDDTGLPYAMLRKRGAEVRLYGTYGVPIRPFEYTYQKSLAAAYEKEKPAALPFRFGYQMNNVESRSTLMVARLPPRPAGGAGAR